MALIRVDYAALAVVANHMQHLPQNLATTRQEINTARGLSMGVGEPTAAAITDELLRRLGWLIDMSAEATAGLARALVTATGEYATAEDIAVRFDQ